MSIAQKYDSLIHKIEAQKNAELNALHSAYQQKKDKSIIAKIRETHKFYNKKISKLKDEYNRFRELMELSDEDLKIKNANERINFTEDPLYRKIEYSDNYFDDGIRERIENREVDVNSIFKDKGGINEVAYKYLDAILKIAPQYTRPREVGEILNSLMGDKRLIKGDSIVYNGELVPISHFFINLKEATSYAQERTEEGRVKIDFLRWFIESFISGEYTLKYGGWDYIVPRIWRDEAVLAEEVIDESVREMIKEEWLQNWRKG
jgi:hypothetical protein